MFVEHGVIRDINMRTPETNLTKMIPKFKLGRPLLLVVSS